MIPASRISPASRSSVAVFPCERMRLITSLRLALLKTSGMRLTWRERDWLPRKFKVCEASPLKREVTIETIDEDDHFMIII